MRCYVRTYTALYSKVSLSDEVVVLCFFTRFPQPSYTKCGPWASSASFSGETVRNAERGAPLLGIQ